MATELGKAYVQIVPSAQGISGAIQQVLDPEAKSAGQSAGESIGGQIASFATKAIAALGVGKMISDAITNGMDFETTMTKASTLFSGTKEELAGFQKELMGISSSTGVAASELAEAAYSAESASVPMGNLGGMIEASAKLATAGFTDIDTALSATAKTMNAYGMMSDDAAHTQENLEKVQRILIQTQNKGITTVGELGASLAQVTPTAAAFGVSFEQVGASLAGMTAQGTPTAQATTQLNALIAELGKSGTQAAKNLEKAAEGTEFAGMSFSEMMEHGADLNGVLYMMQQLADENDLAMVDMFSSIEAGKAAMSITNSDWLGNMEAMATEADVVGEAYSTMSDTVDFKMNQFKNTLQNLGIEAFSATADTMMAALDGLQRGFELIKPALDTLGEAFGNLFTSISDYLAESTGLGEDFDIVEVAASALSDVINTLSDVINFLAENMETIAPIVEAVVAGFIAFQTVQFVIGFIQGITTAFGALNAIMLMNPIGLIVAAIAALVAGLVVLYNKSEAFRTFVDGVWAGIKEFAASIAEFFTGVFNTVTETFDNIKSNVTETWDNIKGNLSQTWDNIKSTASSTWDNIKSKASSTWDGMKSTITNVASDIKSNVSSSLSAMKSAYDSHGGGMKGVASALWTGIKGYYSTGFSALNTLSGGKLGEIANLFKSKFDGIINQARSWGSDIISNIASGITSAISKVTNAVSNVANTIKSYLHFSEPDVGPLANFHTYMPDMMEMLTSGIEKGIPSVKRVTDELAENMIPVYNVADVNAANATNRTGSTSNNNVTINVYGAEGQDINALAEIIQEKINNAVNQRELVYA